MSQHGDIGGNRDSFGDTRVSEVSEMFSNSFPSLSIAWKGKTTKFKCLQRLAGCDMCGIEEVEELFL